MGNEALYPWIKKDYVLLSMDTMKGRIRIIYRICQHMMCEFSFNHKHTFVIRVEIVLEVQQMNSDKNCPCIIIKEQIVSINNYNEKSFVTRLNFE